MALSRSRARLITALAVVALGSMLFGWTSAPAEGIASTITLDKGDGKFFGDVSAGSPCQAGRVVTVAKTDGTPFGSTTTNSAGHYEMSKKGSGPGEFVATVGQSFVQGDSYGYGSVTCDSAQSNTVKVRKHKKRRGGGGGGGGGAFSFKKLIRLLKKLGLDTSGIRIPNFPGF